MKEPERYNSVKRTLQRQNVKKRLSTNFTHTTMQRVHEAVLAREKRENRIVFFVALAASLLIIIGCVVVVAPMMDFSTLDLRENIIITSMNMDVIKLYFPILVAVIVLLLLDIKMRAIFKKMLDNQ